MNKSEFIDAVSQAAGLSKMDAGRAVDGMINVIGKTLKKGEPVTIVGFGTFELRQRAARQGRNPKTGEPISIPASKAPAFKAGKGLKDMM